MKRFVPVLIWLFVGMAFSLAWLAGTVTRQQNEMQEMQAAGCQCGCKKPNCDCPKDEVFGQTYDEKCPEWLK